jgi:alpha-beta hydrolase superfamily lysophospholipase
MFEYFPDNYPWSLSVVWAAEASGTFSEIHDAIRGLKAQASAEPAVSGPLWYDAWSALAAQRLRVARDMESKGFVQGAGRGYLRSAIYELMAIRFLSRDDIRGTNSYASGSSHFLQGLKLLGQPARVIDVAYEHGRLPGLLGIPSGLTKPAPCLMVFGGFDSLKEWVYPLLIEPCMRRGLALFVVDQPGVGGALRLFNLPAVPEAERAASACIDALDKVPEIDVQRIGLSGISLGGYYAPRAAAFEPRIAACCAWGGIWDLGMLFDRNVAEPGKARSIPDMLDHARWVFGAQTKADALAIAHRMTLEPVIERITCPLLVLHGANDRQVAGTVSEDTARRAINSRHSELKVFTLEDGGSEHCQLDNTALAVDYMADWFAEALG